MKKIALVTGSNRGIGAATIIELAKRKCDVVINYNNDVERAEHLKKEVEEKYGVKALIVKADISVENECKDLVNKIINEFGRIDILVNNAGIVLNKPINERSVDEFNNTINTNLVGSFVLCKLVSKYMINNKYGKIVNVSSTNGINAASPEAIDYNCSKAGLITLTKDFAMELSPYINVNAVAPGWVDTEMNSDLPEEFINNEINKIWLKRFAKPEEIAKVIAFLTSDDASYIHGEIIKIDGGY